MYTDFDETNILDYLLEREYISADDRAVAQPLAWGVSNIVLRIHGEQGPDFVVKQSRPQLRTKVDWFSRPERIFREIDFMRGIGELLPEGTIPLVLFEDREQFLFGMSAVCAEHRVWKGELLAERIDPTLAVRLGAILADLHRLTAERDDLRDRWGDREVFDELRLDPFYRHLQRVHSELKTPLQDLIDETLGTSLCAVHADFSPKNILLHDDTFTLVDFETGHYGDPAFDLGFFLSHILLKGIARPSSTEALLQLALQFWEGYTERLTVDVTPASKRLTENFDELTDRALRHLSACLLSRIDGKSTVDYLTEPSHREFGRQWGIDFLREVNLAGPVRWSFHHYLDEFSHRLFAMTSN